MKTKVRDTSLAAYKELKDVNVNQFVVYCTIKQLNQEGKRCTDYDISKALEWEINRVTPRRNELEKSGRVKSAGKTIGETGRQVYQWTVVEDKPKQQELKVEATNQLSFF